MSDTIGLKIGTASTSARTIAIIRKYSNDSMGAIKKNIQNRDYVLLFSGSITFSVCLMVTGYVRHP